MGKSMTLRKIDLSHVFDEADENDVQVVALYGSPHTTILIHSTPQT